MSKKHTANLTPKQCRELKRIIDTYTEAHSLRERGASLFTSPFSSNDATKSNDVSDLSSKLELVNYLHSLLAEAEISKSHKNYKQIATIHRKEVELFGARSGRPPRPEEDIINPLKEVVGEIDEGIVEAIRRDFER